MRSTSPGARDPGRRALLAAAASGLAASCAAPAPLVPSTPVTPDGWFALPDGARLPFRAWLPPGRPTAVALALHGMNDSRDAWEIPGPALAARGIAIYAPDQRGFGEAPGRGIWPGAEMLASDAAAMLALVARRHPGVRPLAFGESMGGAVLLKLAVAEHPPPVSAYVLAAPAVWGRAEMDAVLRGALWLASHAIPEASITGGGPVHVWATDNLAALRRLSRDPLTLRTTRFESLAGLVGLMDDALAAAAHLAAPALCLYGAHDMLVPRHATAAAWRKLATTGVARLAYYPAGYHLLLRDHARALVYDDIVAWLADGRTPFRSGADLAARIWISDPR